MPMTTWCPRELKKDMLILLQALLSFAQREPQFQQAREALCPSTLDLPEISARHVLCSLLLVRTDYCILMFPHGKNYSDLAWYKNFFVPMPLEGGGWLVDAARKGQRRMWCLARCWIGLVWANPKAGSEGSASSGGCSPSTKCRAVQYSTLEHLKTLFFFTAGTTMPLLKLCKEYKGNVPDCMPLHLFHLVKSKNHLSLNGQP